MSTDMKSDAPSRPSLDRPMPPLVLRALRKSIAHWEDLALGRSVPRKTTIGCEHCALCQRFYLRPPTKAFGGYTCEGCPVSARTGHSHCKNTPWQMVYMDNDCSLRAPLVRKALPAALTELKFLRSLLPNAQQDLVPMVPLPLL